MIAKLLPVILMVLGTGAGVGAAMFTASPPSQKSEADTAKSDEKKEQKSESGTTDTEFVRLSNQFVVPIVKLDKVASMIVVSISLETKPGIAEDVYAREPKLRDLFLRVLFDHANMGGFRGAFTDAETLDLLRNALQEVARRELGDDIKAVLITDIARQDT